MRNRLFIPPVPSRWKITDAVLPVPCLGGGENVHLRTVLRPLAVPFPPSASASCVLCLTALVSSVLVASVVLALARQFQARLCRVTAGFRLCPALLCRRGTCVLHWEFWFGLILMNIITALREPSVSISGISSSIMVCSA